ncbi:putative eIF-2B/eIF-5 [Cafeteria roenbergensis virus]|uniref:Putative eIF-2B/eIF-5 n=1 Tax=Cafeteria roenbergensis virus (strain BV-PW1) TaxID=693272 RepID=E3T4C4_CROVB|nr:putative eIF-2B/eIF-5 [Cafeteria roenbergensis virus BV-PW1]ADO67037.1 putative eIF-2B/eIF-5 [Cafeteria roenbergensis virus BV-PW1]
MSDQLKHNPKTLIKYIGFCLGSKTNDDKYWIQGHHSIKKIQQYLFDFINCYVLCYKCKIPELKYTFQINNKISIIKTHCVGCGCNNLIKNINISKNNNNKIYDKIIKDIENNYFNKNGYTSKLESTDDLNIDYNSEFF